MQDIKKYLDRKVNQYNSTDFIALDPICIPHQFSLQQDIELMGFFAAIFAWGQRPTIIAKCKELIERMDGAPYQFITQHQETDLKQLEGFKHRTFNDTDLLYCMSWFKQYYAQHNSLEWAFSFGLNPTNLTTEYGLIGFKQNFFSLPDAPQRTQKHIASPITKSACKRLNMYLRWMVRKDKNGVDFGIWKTIKPHQLVCPLDVHVGRVARHFKLLERDKDDWEAAIELTNHLKLFDPKDPVKYDFALFSLGIDKDY